MTAALLAVCLIFAALGGLGLPVGAEEIQSAYVLRFDGGSQPYLYGSRYEYKHSYSDPAAGKNSVWTYWNAPEIFNLVYTGGDGDRSIAAYCTDADTSTTGDTGYRRINLEDSTYHESGAAARLRSVILNSFPYLTVEQVASNANAVLGEGTIQELTQGEVISATQQAIWEITHGKKYTVDNHYTGIRDMDDYDTADFVYPESLTDCVEGPYTAGNMENLYNYFLGLEGTGPMTLAVSDYSFRDVVYTAEKAADGTYTVTVSYAIDAIVGASDNLTLTATCAGQVQSNPLAAGEGSVTFTGLDRREAVTLEIEGFQTGADVYLFDAEGARSSSQSMVGYDATTLPVYAKLVVTDRVLNIHKTSDKDSGQIPLSGIQFDVYLAATMADIESGEVILPQQPTKEQAAAYQTEANYITTLTTDAQGFAAFNLTTNGCPDGVYLVVERENSAVSYPVEPFFVIIPGTNADGTGYEYTVNVYPKNVIETGPEVTKDVTEIDNDHDTFAVGQTHTWIIRGDIPAGMAQSIQYQIFDTMDYRLTLQGNFAVKVGLATDAANTEAVTLTAGTHYTVIPGTATDAEGHTVDTFTVTLTDNGRKAAAAAVGEGKPGDYEVRVYFDAIIDSDAQIGVEIPNQATLEYTNSAGVEYDDESDIPTVCTGGANLLKVDANTQLPLAGATFRLARIATAEDMADETVAKEYLAIDGVQTQVVFVSFYTDATLQTQTDTATTGEDGKLAFLGLDHGTYYLVETKAPTDYNLLTAPITMEIDHDSHKEEAVITVINTKFTLPSTGGIGTTIFTAAGLLLMAGAGTLTVVSFRKKQN